MLTETIIKKKNFLLSIHNFFKCNKRHEFVCPENERNGQCTTKNCIYCKSKSKKEKQLEKVSENSLKKITNQVPDDSPPVNQESPTSLRYFRGGPCDSVKNSDNDVVQALEKDEDTYTEDKMEDTTAEYEDYVRKSRPKLGALPAFIPL